MSDSPDALEAAIEAALAGRLFCSNCGGGHGAATCEYCDRGLILRAAIRAYGEQQRAEGARGWPLDRALARAAVKSAPHRPAHL